MNTLQAELVTIRADLLPRLCRTKNQAKRVRMGNRAMARCGGEAVEALLIHERANRIGKSKAPFQALDNQVARSASLQALRFYAPFPEPVGDGVVEGKAQR